MISLMISSISCSVSSDIINGDNNGSDLNAIKDKSYKLFLVEDSSSSTADTVLPQLEDSTETSQPKQYKFVVCLLYQGKALKKSCVDAFYGEDKAPVLFDAEFVGYAQGGMQQQQEDKPAADLDDQDTTPTETSSSATADLQTEQSTDSSQQFTDSTSEDSQPPVDLIPDIIPEDQQQLDQEQLLLDSGLESELTDSLTKTFGYQFSQSVSDSSDDLEIIYQSGPIASAGIVGFFSGLFEKNKRHNVSSQYQSNKAKPLLPPSSSSSPAQVDVTVKKKPSPKPKSSSSSQSSVDSSVKNSFKQGRVSQKVDKLYQRAYYRLSKMEDADTVWADFHDELNRLIANRYKKSPAAIPSQTTDDFIHQTIDPIPDDVKTTSHDSYKTI